MAVERAGDRLVELVTRALLEQLQLLAGPIWPGPIAPSRVFGTV